MANKSRKELLNTPDEFITTTTTVLKWIKDNPRRFIALAVIFVVVIGAGAGFYHWRTNREHGAMTAYFQAGPDAGQMSALVQNYSDTRAGRLALLRLAGLAYEQGSYAEALASAEKFINSWPSEDLFYWQAMLIMANAYASDNQDEKALPLLASCIDSAPDAIRNQARYYQGTLLFRLGRTPESRAALQGVEGSYRELARISLSALPPAAGESRNAE